jgi:hypothetical protein
VRGCACHVLRTRCMTNADRGTRIRWRFASRYNTESLTSIIVRAQVSSSDRRHFSPQHAAVHIASSCTPPARCTSRFFIGRLLCLLQGLSRCRHDKKIPARTLFLRPRGCPRGSSRHQGRSDFSWVLPPRAGDPAGNNVPAGSSLSSLSGTRTQQHFVRMHKALRLLHKRNEASLCLLILIVGHWTSFSTRYHASSPASAVEQATAEALCRRCLCADSSA